MREILFRGKRVDNGEWIYGYYIKATDHWHNNGVHEDWIVVDTVQNGGWCNVRGKHAVVPETIGQFTGLTDKDGERIFEGDIIAHWDYYDEIITNRRSVVRYGFLNCGCCHSVYGFSTCDKNGNVNENADLYGDEVCAESACVIGNIIDNPELM